MKPSSYIFIALLGILMFPAMSMAISPEISRFYPPLPNNAKQIAKGYGWVVYQEKTEQTDLFTACRLYLKNSKTGDMYILLETKGDRQKGTKLRIKARNKLAYGLNDTGYKKQASCEGGYIEAVDEVFVVSPSKIIVSGVPDARNFYNYIIDLDTYTVTHIEAYLDYIQTVKSNGRRYLEFFSTEYTANGREEIRIWFDYEGNRVKTIAPLTYPKSYRMAFYVWGKGTHCHSSEPSRTGHAFVDIPIIGCVGFSAIGDILGGSGDIYDHKGSVECATDSCIIYISREQWETVYAKFRELQRNTPNYFLGRYDCTSFVMDIADAAGIKYGTRIEVQTPVYFMEKLKKYNMSGSAPTTHL